MIEPNSNERIASSQITRSSLHYIKLQFRGQRGEHRKQKSPGSDGAKSEAGLLTICKPTGNVPACCIGPTDWLTV